MTEKDIIDYQIKIGLIDVKIFLNIYPFLFSENENESMNVKLKKFNRFRYRNPDFPVRKIGKRLMIDIDELKKWFKKKKNIEIEEEKTRSEFDVIKSSEVRYLPVDKGVTEIIGDIDENE